MAHDKIIDYSLNSSTCGEETDEVEQAIFKLKNSIQDFIDEEKIYNHDLYLLRWLVGANMDLKKAEKFLRAAATWRREFDVPSLLDANFPEGIMESLPLYLDAVTPDGILVCSIQAGLIDFRGLLDQFGRKALVRYLMQIFAQAESVLLETNKRNFKGKVLTKQSLQGILVIADFSHFEARQLRTFEGIQAVIEVCKNLVKYFPYLYTRIIVINCTSVASMAIKIMRPILEGPNLKVEVYGSNRSEWEEIICSLVSPHLLRVPFGGTRTIEEKIGRNHFIDRDSLLLE